jgi:hypothetical protein
MKRYMKILITKSFLWLHSKLGREKLYLIIRLFRSVPVLLRSIGEILGYSGPLSFVLNFFIEPLFIWFYKVIFNSRKVLYYNIILLRIFRSLKIWTSSLKDIRRKDLSYHIILILILVTILLSLSLLFISILLIILFGLPRCKTRVGFFILFLILRILITNLFGK